MSGRIIDGDSSEARLATIVMSMLRKRTDENWRFLDHADFESMLKPHIEIEKILRALDELREHRITIRHHGVERDRLIDRERFLFTQIFNLQAEISMQEF